MLTISQSRWSSRAATFVVWAAASACVAYWGLKFAGAPAGPPGGPVAAPGAQPVDPAQLARLLGAGAMAAAAPMAMASPVSRFALLGVLASRSHGGAALIAIDGKPARPYRVGSKVEEGLVLQSVEPRRAQLGAQADGPASMTLELPLPKK